MKTMIAMLLLGLALAGCSATGGDMSDTNPRSQTSEPQPSSD